MVEAKDLQSSGQKKDLGRVSTGEDAKVMCCCQMHWMHWMGCHRCQEKWNPWGGPRVEVGVKGGVKIRWEGV